MSSIHLLDIHSTPTNTTIPIETLSKMQKPNFSMLLERRFLLSKGCLSPRGRVSMRHFLWRHGRADLDFCFSISLSEALQTDFSLGRRVARSSSTNSLCHLYIYIIVTSNFAVVDISRSSVSAPSARLEPAPQGMGAPKAEIPDNQREFRLQTQHYSLIPTFRITD